MKLLKYSIKDPLIINAWAECFQSLEYSWEQAFSFSSKRTRSYFPSSFHSFSNTFPPLHPNLTCLFCIIQLIEMFAKLFMIHGTPKPWNCYFPYWNIFQNPLTLQFLHNYLFYIYSSDHDGYQIPNETQTFARCTLNKHGFQHAKHLILSRFWWGTHISYHSHLQQTDLDGLFKILWSWIYRYQ